MRIANVTKVYRGKHIANDDLSLDVHPGELFGLLGPNGAGKTTLVKQIVGLLKPTSGSIRIGPHDLIADPDGARQLCAYLPQAQVPIDAFKLQEAIELTGRIRGGDGAHVRQRANELIEALELEQWRNSMGSKLSGGVRRLTGFCMTAVWPGRVVILDEPTNDVDPLRRRLLWDQVRRLSNEGCAVLLVSHNVLEVEKAVDRLALIDRGKLLAEGTPSSLKSHDRDELRLQVMLLPGAATPELPSFVRRHLRVGHRLLTVITESDASQGIGWAQRLVADATADEYALGALTLEDVYLRLIGRDDAAELAGDSVDR